MSILKTKNGWSALVFHLLSSFYWLCMRNRKKPKKPFFSSD